MNVLLVGEESAGAQTLRILAQSSHRVVGVMASPTRTARGGVTVSQLADTMGYQTWPAELVKDPQFAKVVSAENVDLLLNVHSLFVVQPEILDAPRFGSFNLHPGPLPRYAGLNAPSWAIYRGERTHGVTLHQMLPEVDTGPIAYQTIFEIEETDTGLSLSAKCIRAGLALIEQLLAAAARDPAIIPRTPQDLTQRSYFGRETPEQGRLAWSRPASQVLNFVRAADYHPFPSPWQHPRSRMGEQEIGVVKAARTGQPCDAPPGTIRQANGEQVRVACADEWIEVRRLMVNGRYVDAADVLQPGAQLE